MGRYNGSSVWVIQLGEVSALLSMLRPPILQLAGARHSFRVATRAAA
jgi:hypothetical protein